MTPVCHLEMSQPWRIYKCRLFVLVADLAVRRRLLIDLFHGDYAIAHVLLLH